MFPREKSSPYVQLLFGPHSLWSSASLTFEHSFLAKELPGPSPVIPACSQKCPGSKPSFPLALILSERPHGLTSWYLKFIGSFSVSSFSAHRPRTAHMFGATLGHPALAHGLQTSSCRPPGPWRQRWVRQPAASTPGKAAALPGVWAAAVNAEQLHGSRGDTTAECVKYEAWNWCDSCKFKIWGIVIPGKSLLHSNFNTLTIYWRKVENFFSITSMQWYTDPCAYYYILDVSLTHLVFPFLSSTLFIPHKML